MIYIFAGAVNGLVLLIFANANRWLGHTFTEPDATKFSPSFYRFQNYPMNAMYDLTPCFTACITIDTFCSSSTYVRIRRLSSRPQIAYTVVITITLITFVVYSHTLMSSAINDSSCQPNLGFYARLFSFFTTVYYFTAIF